ncbi:MAG: hypothetical protein AAF804_22275, partial [Bacteroidota bacterium]
MNFLLKYRRIFLWGILGLSLLFAAGMLLLRIDFSFDSFYPKDNDDYRYYQAYQKAFFETQNYLIYVAVKRSGGGEVYDAAFIREVDSLFRTLGELEGVDSVLLPTEVPMVRRRGMKYRTQPYLQFETQAQAQASKQRVLSDSALLGTFVTRDQRYLCGYLQIDPAIFDTQQRDLLS